MQKSTISITVTLHYDGVSMGHEQLPLQSLEYGAFPLPASLITKELRVTFPLKITTSQVYNAYPIIKTKIYIIKKHNNLSVDKVKTQLHVRHS